MESEQNTLAGAARCRPVYDCPWPSQLCHGHDSSSEACKADPPPSSFRAAGLLRHPGHFLPLHLGITVDEEAGKTRGLNRSLPPRDKAVFVLLLGDPWSQELFLVTDSLRPTSMDHGRLVPGESCRANRAMTVYFTQAGANRRRVTEQKSGPLQASGPTRSTGPTPPASPSYQIISGRDVSPVPCSRVHSWLARDRTPSISSPLLIFPLQRDAFRWHTTPQISISVFPPPHCVGLPRNSIGASLPRNPPST